MSSDTKHIAALVFTKKISRWHNVFRYFAPCICKFGVEITTGMDIESYLLHISCQQPLVQTGEWFMIQINKTSLSFTSFSNASRYFRFLILKHSKTWLPSHQTTHLHPPFEICSRKINLCLLLNLKRLWLVEINNSKPTQPVICLQEEHAQADFLNISS